MSWLLARTLFVIGKILNLCDVWGGADGGVCAPVCLSVCWVVFYVCFADLCSRVGLERGRWGGTTHGYKK